MVSGFGRRQVASPLGEPMAVHIRGGQIVPRQRGGLTTAATVTGDIELLITLPGPGSASPFARAQLVRDDGETLLTDPGYTATILEMTGIWWTDTATGETGLTVKVTPLRSDFEEPIGFSGLTVLGMSCAPSSASVGGSDVGAQILLLIRA